MHHACLPYLPKGLVSLPPTIVSDLLCILRLFFSLPVRLDPSNLTFRARFSKRPCLCVQRSTFVKVEPQTNKTIKLFHENTCYMPPAQLLGAVSDLLLLFFFCILIQTFIDFRTGACLSSLSSHLHRKVKKKTYILLLFIQIPSQFVQNYWHDSSIWVPFSVT